MKPMNKVLKDWIPDITIPFLDDIYIKGFSEEENDETFGEDGCKCFCGQPHCLL